MKTVAIWVEDNYFQDFMNYVNNHSESITIEEDKNLKDDSFFYERKQELHQIRSDIKSSSDTKNISTDILSLSPFSLKYRH
jgi:hypothetical protein